MAKSMSQRKAAEVAIQERFARLNDSLRERSRRLFAASEAMAFGFGGVAAVARATGMSSATIRKGIQESQAIASGRLEPLATTRSRRAGGGRKKATDKDPTLLTDLQELVESTTRGDPECRLLWTARSLRNLAFALQQRGHEVKKKHRGALAQTTGV
jgi:hypothetical protein